MDLVRSLAVPLLALLVLGWVLTRPSDAAQRPGALTAIVVVCLIAGSIALILIGLT